MRRLLVLAAVAVLVFAAVPLVDATTPAPPRHVEGSWGALGDPYSSTFLFEIRARARRATWSSATTRPSR